jgi:hypothetical protein
MESLSDDLANDRKKIKPRHLTTKGESIYERRDQNKTCTFIKVGTVKNEWTGLSHWRPFRNIEVQTEEGVKYLYIGGCSLMNLNRYYLGSEDI